MPDLPARPDLDQLRRRAKDLLHEAVRGDVAALARLAVTSDRPTLDAAQLTVAREHGFASWGKLKTEIYRRRLIDSGDAAGLRLLLAEHPELAVEKLLHWCDHPQGTSPLAYVAMLRYDTSAGCWRDVPGTGALTSALLDAGAPVDGAPGELETPP